MNEKDEKKFQELIDEFLKDPENFFKERGEEFFQMEMKLLEEATPEARKLYCQGTGRVYLDELKLVK